MWFCRQQRAHALTLGGMVSEIVLIELNDNLARAQAEDIRFGPDANYGWGTLRSRGLLAPQEGSPGFDGTRSRDSKCRGGDKMK